MVSSLCAVSHHGEGHKNGECAETKLFHINRQASSASGHGLRVGTSRMAATSPTVTRTDSGPAQVIAAPAGHRARMRPKANIREVVAVRAAAAPIHFVTPIVTPA